MLGFRRGNYKPVPLVLRKYRFYYFIPELGYICLNITILLYLVSEKGFYSVTKHEINQESSY